MGETRKTGIWRPQEVLRHFAVYLAISTVAIGQPLLQLYGNNLAVFATAKYEGSIVVWFALVVLLVPAALFTILEIALTAATPQYSKTIHHAFVFVAIWMAVLVILRSLSFGHWIIDFAFTAVIATALVYAYQSLGAIKSWLTMLSPLALIVGVTFGFAASNVIVPPKVEVFALNENGGGTKTPIAPPREDTSVLWINLDEAPLFPLLNTNGEINANRFPGFASLAKESTWYRNVTATSQMTVVAVPAILSGMWPKGTTKSPLLGSYPKNLFTLMNGHIAMDVHEIVTALCPHQVCNKISVSGDDKIANAGTSTTIAGESSGTNDSHTSFTAFLKDALVVMGHKMLPKKLREKLPAIDESWGGFATTQTTSNAPTTTTTSVAPPAGSTTISTDSVVPNDPNTVREWQGNGPLTQVPVLRDVITRASRASIPTLHFAHVLLPHRPWLLSTEVRVSPRLEHKNQISTNSKRRHDQYLSMLRQYIATDKIIGDMVAQLKASANWDRTMIVVTADHGITLTPGESYRDEINPKNPGTLEDIYRVPLFIKYPDQKGGNVDDCTAASIDILPTVIATTGINAGWKLDGSDLRSSCTPRASRPIWWPNGSGALRTGVTELMQRVKYYNSWMNANTGVDDIYKHGLSGDLIGSRVPATATVETQLKWLLYEKDSYQQIGDTELSTVVALARGNFTAQRDFSSQEEGLLVIDGVVVGVVDELTGLKSGHSIYWNSTPNTKYLKSGAHTVEMWIADWSTGTAVLHKVK